MKNKRVLYIFIALFVIVVLVLLSSVLFSVKDVNVDIKKGSTSLNSDLIQQNVEKNVGKNIFFINEQEIIDELEFKFPYINIINIERVFPSQLIVHCFERTEVFAVKTIDNKFASIDETGKVLAINEKNIKNISEGSIKENILIETEILYDATLGSFLNNKDLIFIYDFYINSINAGETSFTFASIFKSVSCANQVITAYTRMGARIVFNSVDEDFAAKVRLSIAVLDNLTENERKTYKITINSAKGWEKEKIT